MPGQSRYDDIFIYVMRHGEATALQHDDKSRELTALGRQEVRTAANWLKQQRIALDNIDLALVSPFVRAQQTFESLRKVLPVNEYLTSSDITPEGNVEVAQEYMDALIEHYKTSGNPITSLLLVSHMPFVSYFLDAVCTANHSRIFATASIAVIRYSTLTKKGDLITHFQGLPDRYHQ